MKKSNTVILLFLIAVLFTVFGSAAAQDANAPAFMVSSVVPDEKVVLSTKNFPAETDYTISMADPADPDVFTPVAKFNSKTGGTLSVTVKIPAKFQGKHEIILLLKDGTGATFMGKFFNGEAAEEAPAEEPVIDLPAAAEPAEEPKADEPKADEPAEAEDKEPAAEEAAAPESVTLVNHMEEDDSEAKDEPAETAEEPADPEVTELKQPEAQDEPTETVEEPAEPEVTELKQPEAQDEPAETVELVNEPVVTEFEQPAEPAAEIPVITCDFSVIPEAHIDAVKRDESVTITVSKFPADTTVSVSMGIYKEEWVPAPRPQPRPHHDPRPWPYGDTDLYPIYPYGPQPGFDPDPDPDWDPKRPPAPKGETVTVFDGEQVATFNTGDGSEQQLTFTIPASVKGQGIIAVWLQDEGPCGFYSYNYFYNNSTY